MKIIIVVPTYNEAENIEPITQEIFKYLPDANILIIDDDSTDDTGKIAASLSQANHKIRSISRKGKAKSFAQSYIEGFKEALKNNADYIIQMDADFSHNPKYLPKILEESKNHDVVIGSRYIRGGKIENWSFWRRLVSRGGSIYSKLVAGLPFADSTSGFVGWRREALQKIDLGKINSDGYAFQIEMKFNAYKNNLKIKEIPITFTERKFGASKMRKRIVLEAAFFCLKLLFNNENHNKKEEMRGEKIKNYYRHLEKQFVFLLSLAAILFNLLPFIYQHYNSPPDKTYVGSYSVILDKPTYLSEMGQGREGSWKIINKYTTEPQEKAFIYPLYVAMGHLAKIAGISLETVFLAGRFVFGIILLVIVIYFIRYFVLNENQRKLAYFFALFSSGLGWITLNGKSIDSWIPDAMPMVKFSYFPHFMLANILLLAVILLVYRSFEKENSGKFFIIGGILSFFLNIVLPFTSVLLYFLIAALLVILFFKNRITIKNNLANILIFFIISLPSFLYMYWLGTTNPIWSVIEKQNILPTPSLINLITGYGIILIFSFYGLLTLCRKDKIKCLFFSIWILSVLILAYIPPWIYPMQRRFLETAFYVPLAITASFGIKGIYQYLKQKQIKDLKLKFISFFVMFIVPFLLIGNIQNWFQFKYMVNQTNDPRIYLSNKNIEATKWLKQNSPQESIVLSSFYNGNVIPYYADRFVYVGHGPMTINFEEKFKESENFYSGNFSVNEVSDFLKNRKINYVFYSDEEKRMGKFNPEQYDFLEKVYQNGGAEIYKVKI